MEMTMTMSAPTTTYPIIIYCISYYHTLHIIYQKTHMILHISHIICYTSYIIYHIHDSIQGGDDRESPNNNLAWSGLEAGRSHQSLSGDL